MAQAQKVTVADPIGGIGNDDLYDVVGNISDQLFLYVDEGRDKRFHIYDKNLSFLFRKDLNLVKGRPEIYSILSKDTSVLVYHGRRSRDGFSLMYTEYDFNGNKMDTLTIIDRDEEMRPRKIVQTHAQDKSKTLLFSPKSSDELLLIVLDNHKKQVLWNKELKVENYDLRNDFRRIFITNEGEVNILFERFNQRRDIEKHHLALIGIDDKDGVFINRFNFDKQLSVSLACTYDEENANIIITGLCSEGSKNKADGYYYFIKRLDQLEPEEHINSRAFDGSFLVELYGEKLGVRKDLNDFVIRGIVPRKDGGVIISAEKHKEFYRRSNYGGMGHYGTLGGSSGWLDTYDEDIIIISIHPDGAEHWKTILYKKQFSQDEDFIYSSFFVFRTPSRMRYIYNDQIRNNNTVSEYVIDPLGNYRRNSLLSTDYQNLRLIFGEAKQISSHSFIVPSLRNGNLNLVKIDYEGLP